VQIQKANLQFNGTTLTKRGRTDGVLLHHAAGLGSVEAIHNYHKNTNKWAGIGYNFYIRLDGSIWEGRGWDKVGAHAGASSGYNGKTIGICFEGNYSELPTMPAAQFNAGVWLIKEAFKKYGRIAVWGHREVYATACPGRNFPLDKLKAVTLESEVNEDMKIGMEIPGVKVTMQGKVAEKSVILNVDGKDTTYIPAVVLRDHGYIVSWDAATSSVTIKKG